MNSESTMKRCERGDRCLHLKQVNGGLLPIEAFNKGQGTYGVRNVCRVCQAYMRNTQSGAREAFAEGYGGDFKLAFKDLKSKRNSAKTNRYGAAVLLGISYLRVEDLLESGALEEDEDHDIKKGSILALQQSEIVNDLRIKSSDDIFMSVNRIRLSDKRGGGQKAAASANDDDLIDDGIVEVAEYFLGQVHIRKLYRAGVDEIAPILQPHADRMGVSWREYLKFIAPKLYEALSADEDFINQYETNPIPGMEETE